MIIKSSTNNQHTIDIKPFSAFLLKLYRLLEDNNNIDIVCWSKDGKSFIIKNIHKFQSQILPIYFKHKNFSSFLRQVINKIEK